MIRTCLRALTISTAAGSMPPPRKIYIPEAYLTVNHSRSSGPGGQNVNKVNSKVELRFEIREAHWLPDDVK
jgi:peptidyl-tRNA hydrolase ICT1